MSSTAQTRAARQVLDVNTKMLAMVSGWRHIDSEVLQTAADGIARGVYQDATLEALSEAFGEWGKIASDAAFLFLDASASLRALADGEAA